MDFAAAPEANPVLRIEPPFPPPWPGSSPQFAGFIQNPGIKEEGRSKIECKTFALDCEVQSAYPWEPFQDFHPNSGLGEENGGCQASGPSANDYGSLGSHVENGLLGFRWRQRLCFTSGSALRTRAARTSRAGPRMRQSCR